MNIFVDKQKYLKATPDATIRRFSPPKKSATLDFGDLAEKIARKSERTRKRCTFSQGVVRDKTPSMDSVSSSSAAEMKRGHSRQISSEENDKVSATDAEDVDSATITNTTRNTASSTTTNTITLVDEERFLPRHCSAEIRRETSDFIDFMWEHYFLDASQPRAPWSTMSARVGGIDEGRCDVGRSSETRDMLRVALDLLAASDADRALAYARTLVNEKCPQNEHVLVLLGRALEINPFLSDRHVWPVYCVGMEMSRASSQDGRGEEDDDADEHGVAKLIREEREFLTTRFEVDSKISRYVADLRALECDVDFINMRNEMVNAHVFERGDDDDDDDEEEDVEELLATSYSWVNFAYGQVFFPAFYREFLKRPQLREAFEFTDRLGLDVVVLGANVGTEAMFLAAGLGSSSVRVVGYEIMCPFVEMAESLRARHGIENARFVCADALEADIGHAGIVFVDNQAWDEQLMSLLWRKLSAQLPVGAVVFEYTGADYYASMYGASPDRRWDLIQCSRLDVSWFVEDGTHAAIYRKRTAAISGKYNDWFDFQRQLETSWESTKRLLVRSSSSPSRGRDAKEAFVVRTGTADRSRALLKELTTSASSSSRAVSYSLSFDPSTLELSTTSRRLMTTPAIGNRISELFHRALFAWHVERFDLLKGRPLLSEETSYLDVFFRHAGREHRNFQLLGNWTGNRMSSFSYSHRVRLVEISATGGGSSSPSSASQVDSSRFRFGTTSQFSLFLRAARPVLERRKIREPLDILDAHDPKHEVSFYGLGWDRSKGHFKVYLMLHDLSILHARHKALLYAPYDDDDGTEAGGRAVWTRADILPHALLSFTYDDLTSELYEEKVYVYPRTMDAAIRMGASVPDDHFVSSIAIMYSSRRGMVSQIDIDHMWSCVWRRKLSAPGRAIVDEYMDRGLFLETLAVKSKDEYTLYFPAGSG
eukprot:g999.t1